MMMMMNDDLMVCFSLLFLNFSFFFFVWLFLKKAEEDKTKGTQKKRAVD